MNKNLEYECLITQFFRFMKCMIEKKCCINLWKCILLFVANWKYFIVKKLEWHFFVSSAVVNTKKGNVKESHWNIQHLII